MLSNAQVLTSKTSTCTGDIQRLAALAACSAAPSKLTTCPTMLLRLTCHVFLAPPRTWRQPATLSHLAVKSAFAMPAVHQMAPGCWCCLDDLDEALLPNIHNLQLRLPMDKYCSSCSRHAEHASRFGAGVLCNSPFEGHSLWDLAPITPGLART